METPMGRDEDQLRGGLNRLRELWREGRCALGAMPSVPTVQVMARSGLDWIIIDMEHGAIDLGAAHAMVAATAIAGIRSTG